MRKVSKDVEDVVSKPCHGSSTRIVTRELGLSQSCFQRIKQQCLPSLKCPLQGRPRVLSSRQERACVHAVTVEGKENASEVIKELRESECEWVDCEKGSQTSWVVFQSETEETKTFFKAHSRSFRFCKEAPKLDCKWLGEGYFLR